MPMLTKAGYVRSYRGNNGGYMLAKEPEEYTAGDIIRTTEGSLAPIACLDDVPNRCERQDQCSTLEFWEGLKKVIDQYVDSVTLADLVNNHEEKCGKLHCMIGFLKAYRKSEKSLIELKFCLM